MLSLLGQFDRILIFDTETTGIEFAQDEIIELGAVCLTDQGETDSLDLLIRLSPGRTLPPFITELTGITDHQLRLEGVEKAEACRAFCALLEGAERPLSAPLWTGGRPAGPPFSGRPDGLPGPAGLSP